VPGTSANAPRTICCGPGISNWEFGFVKDTSFQERYRIEFRGELFTRSTIRSFSSPNGNIKTGGTSGE